jgi:hypothetical protein
MNGPSLSHASRLTDSRQLVLPFSHQGETGSYRYMAPECFRHEPYNLQVCIEARMSGVMYLLHEAYDAHILI